MNYRIEKKEAFRIIGMAEELERRIVTEWLSTSGYEYDDGPDIEVYLSSYLCVDF